MKKIFRIEVDCAGCAAKMEAACAKIKGISAVSVSFITGRMTVDFEEDAVISDVLKQIIKTCKKIDRGFEISPLR